MKYCKRCQRHFPPEEPAYRGAYGYDMLCVVCYAELHGPFGKPFKARK